MRKIFAIVAILSLAACGKSTTTETDANYRPDPPTFSVTGNAPAPAVAKDFIAKYSRVIGAAIQRTPYDVKDPVQQAASAQKLYREDVNYLLEWESAGQALFIAADDMACRTYVSEIFSAWTEAYPVNGPVTQAEMDKKRALITHANEVGRDCSRNLDLPNWGQRN